MIWLFAIAGFEGGFEWDVMSGGLKGVHNQVDNHKGVSCF